MRLRPDIDYRFTDVLREAIQQADPDNSADRTRSKHCRPHPYSRDRRNRRCQHSMLVPSDSGMFTRGWLSSYTPTFLLHSRVSLFSTVTAEPSLTRTIFSLVDGPKGMECEYRTCLKNPTHHCSSVTSREFETHTISVSLTRCYGFQNSKTTRHAMSSR